MSSSTTINTVVLGYGLAGKGFHSYLVSLTPGLTLYGVMARSESVAEKVKQDFGPNVKYFTSFENVLSDENVQLVVVATPNETHPDYALKALEAKKHVVVDKPLCISVATCDKLLEAAKKNGVLLTVFQNRRLDGDFLTVKDLITTKKLGEVKWIEMAWQKYGVGHVVKEWKNCTLAEGGGKFWDLGPHMVDQAVQLFGVEHGVKSVYGRMHFDSKELPELDTHALAVIEFGNGATAVIDVSSTALIEKPRFYIVGETSTYAKYGVDPQEAFMLKQDIDNAVEDPQFHGILKNVKGETATIVTLKGRWRNYYENIAQVLLNWGSSTTSVGPLVSVESVRMQLAVMEAAIQSAKSGSTIQLNLPALSPSKQ